MESLHYIGIPNPTNPDPVKYQQCTINII